jgi:hypothetical protein
MDKILSLLPSSFNTTHLILAALGVTVLLAGAFFVYKKFFKKTASVVGFVGGPGSDESGDAESSDAVAAAAHRPSTQQQRPQESESAYYQESSSYQQSHQNQPSPLDSGYSEPQPQNAEAPLASA